MCLDIFFPNSSHILLNIFSSPDVLITSFEKLACIPDPFQSPFTGFGCRSIANPYFSAFLSAKYLATQTWSPAFLAPLAKI